MSDPITLLVLAIAIALAIWGYRRSASGPRQQTFKYKYRRNPFDDAQSFTVEAADQASADELARAKFDEMFRSRETVMAEFYSVKC
jgi:hypothetical protein